MLSMAVLRSTSAHARIIEIDASEVLALPGVAAVLTYADIDGQVGLLPCSDLQPDSKPALQTVLANGVVRYVGEPVAVVVAQDAYAAEDALESFIVEYEELPVVLDPVAACEDGSALLFPDFGTNKVSTLNQDVGDIEAALASADKVYTETFKIHRHGAVPLETRGVVAEEDPVTGRVTVWTSTQNPHRSGSSSPACSTFPKAASG